MTPFVEGNISREELTRLFKRPGDRGRFIWYYKNFGIDGNDEFYLNFINDHINSNLTRAREDAMELTMALSVFKSDHLNVITQIIHSSRNMDLKLLCLDWLFNFFESVPQADFEALNLYALHKCKGELLSVQAILNLLLLKNDEQLVNKLKTCISQTAIPSVCYRVFNKLEDAIFDNMPEITKKAILDTIQKSTALNSGQKADLVYPEK